MSCILTQTNNCGEAGHVCHTSVLFVCVCNEVQSILLVHSFRG